MATRPVDPQPQEQTCFTNQPSNEPWTLTTADAETVIDSWLHPREPGKDLKAAYAQYLETVRPA